MLMAQLQHSSDMVSSRKGMEGEGMTPFSPTQAIAAKTGISRSQFSLPYDAENACKRCHSITIMSSNRTSTDASYKYRYAET
ncbi:uncharacterized protein TNCT_474711 [Trichonephila clavata]|uniref:Uncharacterized protein n=1 Tax=Trichonephila clavata TaxID=2740835 RepID=A0A8X6KM85_TRICU|nr:uncharacterized protein TNCT_474711 [Trichonephila clavata]